MKTERQTELIIRSGLAVAIAIASWSQAQAQAPNPSHDTMPMGAKKPMDPKMKPMSVTGCVAEKDGHYMLNNAMMAGHTEASSYDLVGGDLKAHVGHHVEVTGSMDPATSKAAPPATGKMGGGAMGKGMTMDKGKMGAPAPHGAVRVTSVKMLATTCPPASN